MRPREIHVVLDAATAMGRAVLEGMAEHAGRRVDWRFHPVGRDGWRRYGLAALGPESADAIVGAIAPPIAEQWSGPARRRVINVSRGRNVAGAANVTCDDAAIGRLAAEHLLGKPVRHFAYAGVADTDARLESFERTVAAHGGAVEVLRLTDDAGAYLAQGPLAERLAALARPCGLLAFNDLHALDVLRAAHEAGLRVPQDLAVVGADDDRLVSLFAPTALSSVDPAFHEVGRRAARALAAALAGEDPPAEPIRVPPRGVVERHSSDFPGHGDDVVLQAARLIEQRACEGLTVAAVAEAVPATRRSLERRFRAAMGRTVLEQIRHVRVQRAARLLRTTARPIDTIARETGFPNASHFCATFRKAMHLQPGRYRRRHQSAAPE